MVMQLVSHCGVSLLGFCVLVLCIFGVMAVACVLVGVSLTVGSKVELLAGAVSAVSRFTNLC